MSHPNALLPKRSENEGPQRLFDAGALGASFQQLAVDVVKGDSTDFMSRWFRAKTSDADLVIWTDGEKRIIKHQLCFHGQVVEWTPIHGTRTGLVIEEELGPPGSAAAAGATFSPQTDDDTFETAGMPVGEPGGSTHDVAETIRFDQTTAKSVVLQAIQVLARVPDLNESDRASLIYNFRESPKLHKRAAERALKVWAPKVDELTSTTRPKFWKRLRSWVRGD